MTTLSFMTANYVARETGYRVTEGWMQGDDAVNAYFAPVETYAARFAALLAEIQGLGFTAIDLWLAHLNWRWATDEHIAIAQDLLQAARLPVASLAGWFGDTPADVAASCRIAAAVGAPILGGNCALIGGDLATLAALMRDHGLVFGYENHPERNPGELLARIGDAAPDAIGACVDTGWFGTHGYPAPAALTELAPRLVYVHLKDVLAAGGHDTCTLGDGVVDIPGCLAALRAAGYSGGLSIEHEPFLHDPGADCVESLARVKAWLG